MNGMVAMPDPMDCFWYSLSLALLSVPLAIGYLYLKLLGYAPDGRQQLGKAEDAHARGGEEQSKRPKLEPLDPPEPELGPDVPMMPFQAGLPPTPVMARVDSLGYTDEMATLGGQAAGMPQCLPQSSTSSSTPRANKQQPNFVDVLLHNVSHVDMILNVGDSNDSWNVAKPRFNHYGPTGELILDAVRGMSEEELHSLHVASVETTDDGSMQAQVPTGFNLKPCDLSIKEKHLKFGRREKPSSSSSNEAMIRITAAYFPLITTLVRKWVRGKEEGTQKIIYLVSGVGTPIDTESDYRDNSTHPTSRLMKLMLERNYPNIQVICVHSLTNLFRYDENIVFVKKDLLPRIHALRDELAETTPDWRARLALTVSFADGSSARVGAINASLRNYRPNYMHFWQLKRFWKEQRLCETDVEYHSFSEIATIPAVPVGSRYSTEARMVVEEMIKYREEFHTIRCLGSDDQDLGTFWMRKTKKPVLSVLLVRRANGSLQLVRGTNMEVSMPTGSLCAERNAIGSALGQGLRLRRKDIIGVAVLGTSLKEDIVVSPMESPPITPSESPVPGSPARSRDNSVFDSPSPDPWTELGPPSSPLPPRHESRSNSVTSQQSGEDTTGGANRDRSTSVGSQDGLGICIDTDLGPAKQSNLTPSPSRVVYRSMRSMHTQGRTSGSKKTVIAAGDNGSPQAAVNLLEHRGTERTAKLSRGRVVKTIVVNPGDRNPLRPCGACSEWLKKIAEVNPKFFVITFTDEACSGIYIEEIDSSE